MIKKNIENPKKSSIFLKKYITNSQKIKKTNSYLQHESKIYNGIKNQKEHKGLLIIQNIIFNSRKNVMIKTESGGKSLGGIGIIVGVREKGMQQSDINHSKLDHGEIVVDVSFESLGRYKRVQDEIDVGLEVY